MTLDFAACLSLKRIPTKVRLTMFFVRIGSLLVVLVILVSGVSPATADMIIRLKNGSTIRIPIRPADLASIQFGQPPSKEAVSLPEAPKPAIMSAPSAAAAEKPGSRFTVVRSPPGPKLKLGTFTERAPRTVPYRDDSEVVRVIEALPPGASAILPNFTVEGESLDESLRKVYRNGPQRRDYCNKMVYAPDRGTALYAGANHGVPHVFNDAWEFHLRSNSWHLLFPPDGGDHRRLTSAIGSIRKGRNVSKNKAFLRRWFTDNVRLKDGTLQTKNGGPIRPWHTWDGLTYDRRTGRMLWAVLDSDSRYLDLYAQYTGQDAEALRRQLRRGTSLWMFDPDVGHWVRQTGGTVLPKLSGNGDFLQYIPDLGMSVRFVARWNDDEGMWAYDRVANQWTRLHTNNRDHFYHWAQAQHPKPEQQVAYSPKHKKLVAVRGTSTHIFDLRTNAWTKVQEDPDIFAHDKRTVFAYDTINDVFLLAYPDPQNGYLKAYSIETNQWTNLTPKGAGLPRGKAAGYFDERDGVFVLYLSSGATWIYRYGLGD